MNNLLQKLKDAVVEGYADRSIEITQECLREGIPAKTIFEQAIVLGIQEAGVLWDCNRYRVPDVILSADAFNSAVAVIEKQLETNETARRPKVVLGVVEGDVHDLGKNILAALLRGAGFEVVDIGVDLSSSAFVDAVRREKPEFLGIGAYMSSSMLEIKDVIQAVETAGLRANLSIMVGGVVSSEAFAKMVGADIWAPDATTAVQKVKEILNRHR